jgi:hypothetical protein
MNARGRNVKRITRGDDSDPSWSPGFELPPTSARHKVLQTGAMTITAVRVRSAPLPLLVVGLRNDGFKLLEARGVPGVQGAPLPRLTRKPEVLLESRPRPRLCRSRGTPLTSGYFAVPVVRDLLVRFGFGVVLGKLSLQNDEGGRRARHRRDRLWTDRAPRDHSARRPHRLLRAQGVVLVFPCTGG